MAVPSISEKNEWPVSTWLIKYIKAPADVYLFCWIRNYCAYINCMDVPRLDGFGGADRLPPISFI
jgi:hypothetical protein